MDKFIIKYQVKTTGEAKIEVDGNADELLAGVLTLIKSLYHNTRLNFNENTAKWFVGEIAQALSNPAHPLYEEVYKEDWE